MSQESESICRIALTLIPQVGVITAKQLLSVCGSAQAVFESSKKALLSIPGVGPQIVANIHRKTNFELAETEFKFIKKNDVSLLFYTDPAFPTRLKYHADAPYLLFFKGNADLNSKRIVAIVGTRQPTLYGKMICEELISGLVPYNCLIVSGLAYGIDATAHRKCITLGHPNIGVLGHGMKMIYPAAHRNIAHQMEKAGGLLTEYISSAGPEREHFPMRNRIIAGMCDALVVVETGKKGGSIISANIANSYCKDVFAFPGKINDDKSMGCNQLIKKHKASLIENADDLVTTMGWKPIPKTPIQTQLFIELNDQEKLLLGLFRQSEVLHVDFIAHQGNLNNSQLSSTLLNLEFKGLIKALPGNQYRLINQ